MKKLAIVGPLGLLVVASSHGQDVTPFTVRVGYDYLTNKTASDATKQGGYTVGLGYDFFHVKSMHAKISLDADFSVHTGNGNKIETGSLLVVGRAPFMPGSMAKGQPDFYYGIGAGVVRTFLGASSTQTINTSSSTTTNTSHTSSLAYVGGGEILLGCRFTKELSAELFWRVHSHNTGVDTDSAGIVVGYHF